MEYRIPEENMQLLAKKLNRIRNKANQYGIKFDFKVNGEEVEEGIKYFICEGECVALIEGWEFIATIEHNKDGNIIRNVSNIDVPTRYRTVSAYCEHCNTSRNRKASYIVRNVESNEFKQVGGNCLCDYTHGLSVEHALLCASWIRELEEATDISFSGGCYSTFYYELKPLIEVACEVVKRFGYTPSSEMDSTKVSVMNHYLYLYCQHKLRGDEKLKIDREAFNISNDSINKSGRILDWIGKQDTYSDYMYNLVTICKMEHVEGKHIGYLASLIPTYDKAMSKEKERQRVASASRHVGEIGARISIDVDEMRIVTSYDSQFGYVYIYKIVDKDGNIYIWKTSKGINVDDVSKAIATVKEHSEFNGAKQTIVTRLKKVVDN